jgi:hypothetical protein
MSTPAIAPPQHTSRPREQQANTKVHQPVGWGNAAQNEPSFGGGGQDGASVKAKTINLINSVRTLMRSELTFLLLFLIYTTAFLLEQGKD